MSASTCVHDVKSVETTWLKNNLNKTSVNVRFEYKGGGVTLFFASKDEARKIMLDALNGIEAAELE